MERADIMPKVESFDKKKIIFIGNSFTFFGKCVSGKSLGGVDNGYFYELARSFGDDVTVTDFTWGGASFWHKGDGYAPRMLYEKIKELHPAYYNNPQGLPIDSFYLQDVAVLQQSGDSINETYEDARLIMELFPPETVFGFYITTYDAFHSFEPSFEAARKIRDEHNGVYIPLGHLINDIIKKEVILENSLFEYDKNSFVVCREHDKFHPNTLTGYLTALCVYSAFTQKELLSADHSFVRGMDKKEFYSLGDTNHHEIIASDSEMLALKRLVYEYCVKYNNF